MQDREYLGMSIELGRQEKHRRGIAEHRGDNPDEPFNGHPVVELYSESLDAINYANEARLRADVRRLVGAMEMVDELERHAYELAKGARLLAKMLELVPNQAGPSLVPSDQKKEAAP